MAAVARVGVKFCGNCNPHVDSGGLLCSIKHMLKNANAVEFTAPDSSGLDLLLVLSGCPADCAERPPGVSAEIVIAGETVDRVDCPPGQIAGLVAQKLSAFSGRSGVDPGI